MARQRRSRANEGSNEGAMVMRETVYRGRTIRIEQPRATEAARAASESGQGGEVARLFIDDEEVPVEVTDSGVIGHDMAFKEYGSLEELAEDIIRQRGTAEIVRGDATEPSHHESR